MKDALGHGSDARGDGAKTLAEQHGFYKPGMGRSAFASIPGSYFNKDGTLKPAAHQTGVEQARNQPRSAMDRFLGDIERSFSTRVQDDPAIKRPSVLKYDNS